MKRFAWQWLVISSLLFAHRAAIAEMRPQYGGTLRVAMHDAPSSLDPADGAHADSLTQRNLVFLIFDTLVGVDASGRLHPGLATAWTTADNRRWQLRLRREVRFHDGTAVTPEAVAASLRFANPAWTVVPQGDSLAIEQDSADPGLPAELALPRNAIVKRGPEATLIGTGPFRIGNWQPGKKLALVADENCWKGRPYLDAIEVEMARTFHDQLIALELGRADLIEVSPEQSHRLAVEGRSVVPSEPVELVALLFSREPQTPEEKLLRDALALSVDRASIRTVLVQGAGQITGSILPQWMTGYGFVFPSDTDLPRAREDRDDVKVAAVWTLGYDPNDSIAHLLADRIALNARDAGLTLQPTPNATADLRIARIPLAVSNPWITLREVAACAGLPKPDATGGSVEELYLAEQTMLAAQRIIPLIHLPVTYAAGAALRDWRPGSDGRWDLADAWLETGSGKP